MNKSKFLALLLVTFNFSIAHAAMDHSGHGGNSSNSNSRNSSIACEKPVLSKQSPAKMETTTPNAEFSFRITNVEQASQIVVTVKNIPVVISAKLTQPFFTVTGKLPDSLHDTIARINVRAEGKAPRCDIEDGWLIKISE